MSQSGTPLIGGDVEEESQMGSTQEVRKKGGRKRSIVWKHFTQVDNKTKTKCNYCDIEFANGPTTGTTHLHRHLESACTKIPEEEKEAFVKSKSSKLDQQPAWKYNEDLTRDLFDLLFIDAGIPFHVIDTRFWEPALRSLNPAYNKIGRQTLRNDCVGVFQAGKGATLQEFEILDSRVAFTSDIWTSSTSLGFLCLTAHYIDTEFNLKKKIVAFRKIPFPHKGLAIADLIEEILVEWKLDEKIFSITLDNCSANDNAFLHLENRLWEKSVFGEKGKHMHMRCAAHILNIIVQEGTSVIQPAVKGIRDLMRNIASQGPRLQAFNEIARRLNLAPRKGLILDCPTRWNSTYEMINQALQYKEVLTRFGDSTYQQVSVPTSKEWKQAELIARFLESFLETTKIFSAFRRPTAHIYLKEVLGIRAQLYHDQVKKDPVLCRVAEEMHKKFHKYWEEPNEILTLASILDPRSKLDFVGYYFESLYGELIGKEKLTKLQDRFASFYELYATVIQSPEQAPVGASHPESRGLGKKEVEQGYKKYRSKNRKSHPKRSELDNYLAEDVIDAEYANFDILQWWKKNSELYPTLARMARDFLAVPVSTVASESAFSAAGQLLDHLRNSMVDETAEALICTKDWFGPDDGNFDLEQFRPFMINSASS